MEYVRAGDYPTAEKLCKQYLSMSLDEFKKMHFVDAIQAAEIAPGKPEVKTLKEEKAEKAKKAEKEEKQPAKTAEIKSEVRATPRPMNPPPPDVKAPKPTEINRDLKFIRDLLAAFTPNNIKTLLQYKNVNKILFNVAIDQSFLILKILNNASLKEKFFNVLRDNPHLLNNLDLRLFFTPPPEVKPNALVLVALISFLILNGDLAYMNILAGPETAHRPATADGRFDFIYDGFTVDLINSFLTTGVPTLSYLTAKEDDTDFIGRLFRQKPDLKQHIQPRFLRRSKALPPFPSALDGLVVNSVRSGESVHHLIDILIANDMDIIKLFDLYDLLPELFDNGYYEIESPPPLFFLSVNYPPQNPRQILKLITRHNPSIFAGSLSAKILLFRYNFPDGKTQSI